MPGLALTPHEQVTNVIYDAIRVADLTPEAYSRLRQMNLRENGLMQKDISDARHLGKIFDQVRDSAYVIVARTPDREVIGWSLLFDGSALDAAAAVTRDHSHELKRWNGKQKRSVLREEMREHGRWRRPSWICHFYVKRQYRRQKIGTGLFARTKLIRKTFFKYDGAYNAYQFFQAQQPRKQASVAKRRKAA